jgi:hypothetical protein
VRTYGETDVSRKRSPVADDHTSKRASVHLTIDRDLAAKLRAFAGFHGRDISDVVADGVRLTLRGFRIHQEAPRANAGLSVVSPDGVGGAGAEEVA